MDTIEEFGADLLSDIYSHAAASGMSPDDAFFSLMSDRLASAGEIETADRAFLEGTVGNKNFRIDGSGGDPRDSEGVLSLIICDFQGADEMCTLNAADTKRIFGRLVNFPIFARREEFRESVGTGNPPADLVELIYNSWKSITKIKLILVTNAIYSARTDAVLAGKIAEIPVTYNVWDLSRFHRYDSSGQAREDVLIDMEAEYGGGIPALPASFTGSDLQSYLLVVPGAQIAQLYEKWGSRLLESNVRSFLQARAKVNQGIRDTIRSEPAMFFSYNNGISATADEVTTQATAEGLRIVSIRNLQIVNGGQTTASIHAAQKTSPENLAKVCVQMKLTVVPVERSEDIVPKISEYANSQNKVSAADFFSNHPFHIRMEGFSRRILAPAPEGSNRETKWFYERARGQYLVERAKRSEAEKRRFDAEFPKSQFFAKPDLAKVDLSFREKPDRVSRGAQKNFADFAKDMGEAWSKGDGRFDEVWYRQAIAKLIIFRFVEKAVPRQSWYPGGYRANIVTYAIAKVVADAGELGLAVDLDLVWKTQSVGENLATAFLKAAEAASDVITHPLAGMKNITEWAKKQACWENLRRREVTYVPSLSDCLIERAEAKALNREARRDSVMVSGVEAQGKVIAAGAAFWASLRGWGTTNRKISLKDDGILRACEGLPARIPSEKQSMAALEILARSQGDGFEVHDDITRVKLTGWQRPH